MRSSKSTIRATSLPSIEKNVAIDVDSSRKGDQISANMALEIQDHEVGIGKTFQEKSGTDQLEAFSSSLRVNKDLCNSKTNETHVQKQKAKEIISKRMYKKSGDSINPTSSSPTYHDSNLNTKHTLKSSELHGLSPHDLIAGKEELQNLHQRNDGYFGQMKMQLQPFQSNDGTIVYMDPISGQFFQPAPNIFLNDAMVNQQCTPVINTFPHYEESPPPHIDSKTVQTSLNERLPTHDNSKHIQSSFNDVRKKESLSENNSVSQSLSPSNIDDKSTRSSKGSTKSSQLTKKETSVEKKSSISRSFSSSQSNNAGSADEFELNRQESLIKKKTSSRSFSPPNIDKKPRSNQSVIRNKTVSRSFSPKIDDNPKRSSVDSTECPKLNEQGSSTENNNTSYPPSQNNASIPVDTQKMSRREKLDLTKKAVSRSFSSVDDKHTESSVNHIQKCEEEEHSEETEHVQRSEEVKTELEEISHDQTKLSPHDKSFANIESLSPSRSNHSSIANSSKEPTKTALSSSLAQENMDDESEEAKEQYFSTHIELKPRKDQSKVNQAEKGRPKVTDRNSLKERKHAIESDRSTSKGKNLSPTNSLAKKDTKIQDMNSSDEKQTKQEDTAKNNESRDRDSSQDVNLVQESTYKKDGKKVMSLEDYKRNRLRNSRSRDTAPSSKTGKRRNSLNERRKSRDRSMSRESEQQSMDQSTFSAIVSNSNSSDYSSSRQDSGSTYSSEYSSSNSYSDSSRSYDSYDSEYSSDY